MWEGGINVFDASMVEKALPSTLSNSSFNILMLFVVSFVGFFSHIYKNY